ncbi:MAG: hypothetical protein MPJ50_15230 [Pirellulales bacterium]|nr:hypothetical protein [Pirellulales bacterium]
MSTPNAAEVNAAEVLEQEFLLIRAKILEVAAKLDRLDRAGGAAGSVQLRQIQAGLDILQESEANRAERVQLAFSLDYEDGWREKYLGKET